MNLLKVFPVLCFLLIASGLKANPYKRTNNFNNYKDPLNEVGYGINVAYMKNDNKPAPQLHLYYSRYLTSYFSIGASYCGIYSKDYHNALSAKISFKVLSSLIFSLQPGVYIKSKIDNNQVLYFLGLGASYQFKLSDKIGLGPMFETHFIQDDMYLIGGFQMAFFF